MLRDERAHYIDRTRHAVETIARTEREVATIERHRKDANRAQKMQLGAEIKQLREGLEAKRVNLFSTSPQPSSCSVLFRDIEVAGRVDDSVALRKAWETGPFRDQRPSALAGQVDTDHERELFELGDWFDVSSVPATDLTRFPDGAFVIQFLFKLRTPYLSKDDSPLHILDNPVRKDRVFGCPMIASTSWKGALRAALRETHGWIEREGQAPNQDLVRLCGTALDKGDATGEAGSLHCFPTFFWTTGIEVINPHTRATKVGKAPIPLESVPAATPGLFTLLYAPRPNAAADDADRHLDEVAKALRVLFTIKGIGAKTSSGYGRCVPEVPKGQVMRKGRADFAFDTFDELVERAGQS